MLVAALTAVCTAARSADSPSVWLRNCAFPSSTTWATSERTVAKASSSAATPSWTTCTLCRSATELCSSVTEVHTAGGPLEVAALEDE